METIKNLMHPYDFQNDITDGFELCVTMQVSVPLHILIRHGEQTQKIPDSDSSLSPAHAIWVPKVKGLDFLDKGASMASPLGYIPCDGGELLPYLCQARRIIELPLNPQQNLVDIF